MEKINSAEDIRAAILLLEAKQFEEGKLLKQEFRQAYESMKPINLIKSTFKEVASSEELKNSFINTSIGFATGYISKLLFNGATHSPLRRLVGTALQFGITNVVAKNPEMVKSMGNGLLNMIKNVKKEKVTKPEAEETTPDNEHRN